MTLVRSFNWSLDKATGIGLRAKRCDAARDEMVADINKKVQIKTSAPNAIDGATWVDTSEDPPYIKVYDGTNNQWIAAAGQLDYFSTDGIYDAMLGNCMANYISGCRIATGSNSIPATSIDVSPGSVMINGILRRNTSTTSTDITAPDAADWIDVWALADTNATTFTVSLVDSGTSPGGSTNPGTNGRMLGSIKYTSSSVGVNQTRNYRHDGIEGWVAYQGNDTIVIGGFNTFGKTFDFIPLVHVFSLGTYAADGYEPSIPSGTSTEGQGVVYFPNEIDTTQFDLSCRADAGEVFNSVLGASSYAAFTIIGWKAYGSYS